MSPLICSPLPVVSVPVATPALPEQRPHMTPTALPNNIGSECKSNFSHLKSTIVNQRPASQATSVKAEPGSKVGSNASTSIANKVSLEISNNNIIFKPKTTSAHNLYIIFKAECTFGK